MSQVLSFYIHSVWRSFVWSISGFCSSTPSECYSPKSTIYSKIEGETLSSLDYLFSHLVSNEPFIVIENKECSS